MYLFYFYHLVNTYTNFHHGDREMVFLLMSIHGKHHLVLLFSSLPIP